MPELLSETQVGAFHRDGFVSPVPALSEADAAAYRRRFEDYERAHDGWYTLSKGQKIHLLQTWVSELVRHERIVDAVADVLGPDVLCWGTRIPATSPGIRTPPTGASTSRTWSPPGSRCPPPPGRAAA